MGEKEDAAAIPAEAAEVVSLVTVPGDGAAQLQRVEAEAPVELTLRQLEEMGFITPIADPRTVRAANQYRLKLLGAMLDPNHDFLYTVPYSAEGGGQREFMTTSLQEAEKYVKAYGQPFRASVKKSGVSKLSQALGLEGRKIEHLGYPVTPGVTEWTQITYEVRHKKSGRVEQGVGLAAADERPGRAMPKHHMIALADTRAHTRAVMRIAGFGEVGAEELMTGIEDRDRSAPVITAPHPMPEDPRPALPASTSAAPLAGINGATQSARAVAAVSAAAPAVHAAQAPNPDTITDAQATKLSQLAKEKLGTTERCVAWLREHAKVSTTRHVREKDYAALMKTLEAMEVP